MIKFRRELPDGATLMVAKNTLMRRASENTKFSTISECSKGMNAWLFVDENVAPTFKKFRSLAKDWKRKREYPLQEPTKSMEALACAHAWT